MEENKVALKYFFISKTVFRIYLSSLFLELGGTKMLQNCHILVTPGTDSRSPVVAVNI